MAPALGLAAALGALTGSSALLAVVAMALLGGAAGYCFAVSLRFSLAGLTVALALLIAQGLPLTASDALPALLYATAGGLLQAAFSLCVYAAGDRTEEEGGRAWSTPAARAALRANLTLRSVSFRHAIRFGSALAAGVAAYWLLGLEEHGFWVPLTILFVLRPEREETFHRLALRAVGTAIGLLLATALSQWLHGDPVAIALLLTLAAGVRLRHADRPVRAVHGRDHRLRRAARRHPGRAGAARRRAAGVGHRDRNRDRRRRLPALVEPAGKGGGRWHRRTRPARFPGYAAKRRRGAARTTGETLSNRTYVIGVGMTKFEKPGTKEGDYPDWAKEAGEKALADAGIPYEDVEQAYAGYCYGDSTYGQRALYQLGLTGIPVVNVNNNCSTGSSALFLARQAVKGGLVECALAVGFEKMEPGSLGVKYTDRTNAIDKHAMRMFEIRDPEQSPPAPQMFGNAGRDHMEKYGSEPDHFAWIGFKNHKHSVNNPYAQFQDEYTLEDIKAAKMIHDPLTKLQCSPTSDGAACAIVASERYVEEHGLGDRAIEIAGQSMVTDLSSTFDESADCMTIVGSDMSRTAADAAYAEAGVAAAEVDVCELHDCFSANELITYEALGFAAEGEAHKLVEAEATTYGGNVVVNPSGGLISKGHPLGATGLAQCSELTWQLRGEADKRQVEGAKTALQHNIGLGGAAVVTVYKPAA